MTPDVQKNDTYTLFEDIIAQVGTVPPDSILSRVIYKDARVNVTVFGFAQGQALSEHSAGQPAILQILQGEAQVTLGEQTFTLQAGAWVHMPVRLPHSIRANTPLVLLLTLLKGQAE